MSHVSIYKITSFYRKSLYLGEKRHINVSVCQTVDRFVPSSISFVRLRNIIECTSVRNTFGRSVIGNRRSLVLRLIYWLDSVHSEIHCIVLSVASAALAAETVLITAHVPELSVSVASPPRLLLPSIPFAFDILCAIRAGGRDPRAYMVVTFRMYISEGYPHAGRFDQRKAVTSFRVDKWQSPTQPPRTDFARSRL